MNGARWWSTSSKTWTSQIFVHKGLLTKKRQKGFFDNQSFILEMIIPLIIITFHTSCLFIHINNLSLSPDKAGLRVIGVIHHHLLLTSPTVAAAAEDVIKPDKEESADDPENMQHHRWGNIKWKPWYIIWTSNCKIKYQIAHYGHNYRGYQAVDQCPWGAESNSKVRLSLTWVLVFRESKGCNFKKMYQIRIYKQ